MRIQRSRVQIFIASVAVLATAAVHAQRPTAPRLLPEETVAFLRIANARDLADRFSETAMGKITADSQVQPLVGHLYGSLLGAFEQIEGQVGASLSELLAIPQGEVCLALVLPPQGRPQVTLIVDVGDQLPVAERLLERGNDLLIRNGNSRTAKEIGDTELLVYESSRGRQRELAVFVRDESVVLASSSELAELLLSNWDGTDSPTLVDNRKFVPIMNRSRGLKDEPPQIIWFLDPLEFAKRVTQGNLAGQAALATMKGLGLENLKAIGGGVVLSTEEFDSVAQSHILIGHPREGVLNMLALTTGDLTPEPWVPRDAASYSTFHWDFEQTYDELVDLFDLFRGEGAWQVDALEPLADRLGVDFEESILKAAAGRFSMVTWVEKPARINSQATLFAIQLADSDTFRDTLKTVAEHNPDRFTEGSYRGVDYYRLEVGRLGQDSPQEQFARVPEPCVGVVGDYLLLTDSKKFFQETIATKGKVDKSLANELDFKLVLNKIQRLLGRTSAGGVSFQRPEETFRLMYELANSPATRDRLEDTEQPILQALREALDEHPLPPFSVIAQYLAPGGAMFTYDELGLHHVAFTLRR